MGCLENDRGGATGIECLLPTGHTKTPFVAGDQPRESDLWNGCTKVVSLLGREFKELVGHHRADAVHTVVAAARATIAVPEKASHRIATAALKFCSQDVRGHKRNSTEESRRVDWMENPEFAEHGVHCFSFGTV